MAKRKRLLKLTISLLKPELSRDDVLRDKTSVEGHLLRSIDKERHSLFTASVPSHPPNWADYLEPHTTSDLKAKLYSASASAVLILEASDRIFAVTWGQGRHLIESDNFVQDFGLRVVLNTVASNQLKSIDAKTIDETTVHTRRDLSRDSSFSAFELDPTRDLLRAVTGTPRDKKLARRLTGADALGIHTYEQVPDLPALAKNFLATIKKTPTRKISSSSISCAQSGVKHASSNSMKLLSPRLLRVYRTRASSTIFTSPFPKPSTGSTSMAFDTSLPAKKSGKTMTPASPPISPHTTTRSPSTI